jgi:hypothetical protein
MSIDDFIADNGDPNGRKVQTRLANWVGRTCHIGRLLVFSIPIHTVGWDEAKILDIESHFRYRKYLGTSWR